MRGPTRGNPFGVIADLVRRHADVARPLRLAEVVDTSRYAASGPSFIEVMVAGSQRTAVYRDGPEPPIGSAVQVVRMGPDAGALYLALPLPQPGCRGVVFVSARNLTDDAWAILKYDLQTGIWQRLCDHPVAGSYDARPIRSAGGDTLFTWGRGAAVGSGGPAYRSTDGGLTWSDTGLSGVCFISTRDTINTFFAYQYAVADDGGAIYLSDDGGASWTAQCGAPSGGGTWVAATWSGQGNSQGFGLATSGQYYTLTAFRADFPVVGEPGMYGPWTPGSAGGYGALHLGGSWAALPYGAGEVTGGGDGLWAVTTPPGALPAGAAIAGGPGSTGGGGWFTTRGAGGVLATVVSSGLSPDLAVVYDATNHPAGLDVGLRGATIVWYQEDGDDRACWFAAIDADDAGAARFAAGMNAEAPYSQLATPWQDAGASQAGQLGAAYAASDDGVAALADNLY